MPACRELICCSILLLALFAVACGGAVEEASTAVPTANATANALSTAIAASAEPPRDPVALAQQIEAAAVRWQEAGISRYRIEVRFRQPTWNTQIIEMTVEGGTVIDSNQSCFPTQNCILQDVDPQSMTVENMFFVAREILNLDSDTLEITFNQNIGYPLGISYDDGSWVFSNFEQLAPAP